MTTEKRATGRPRGPMKREARVLVNREQMNGLRFAADQLDARAAYFESSGLQVGAINCRGTADILRSLVAAWKVEAPS